MTIFSKSEVVEITGLSPRLIHFYVDQEVIMPRLKIDLEDGISKTGHRWIYFEDNIIDLLIVKELSYFGIKGSKVKQIIKEIRLKLSEYEKNQGSIPTYIYVLKTPKGNISVKLKNRLMAKKELSEYVIFVMINYQLILKKIKPL